MMGGTVGSSTGVINVFYAPIHSKGTYRGLTLCRALLGAREILRNIVEVQSGHRVDDDLMGGHAGRDVGTPEQVAQRGISTEIRKTQRTS